MTDDGWLDLTALLVPSDGSRLPGGQRRNDTRDRGSKLVFFDPVKGDNPTAEVYWWDGKRIVDSSGSAVSATGAAYGDNPLLPNMEADLPSAASRSRTRTTESTHSRKMPFAAISLTVPATAIAKSSNERVSSYCRPHAC